MYYHTAICTARPYATQACAAVGRIYHSILGWLCCRLFSFTLPAIRLHLYLSAVVDNRLVPSHASYIVAQARSYTRDGDVARSVAVIRFPRILHLSVFSLRAITMILLILL